MADEIEDSRHSLTSLFSLTETLQSSRSAVFFRWIGNLMGAKRRISFQDVRKSATKHALQAHSWIEPSEHKPWIDEATKEVLWSKPRILAHQMVHTKTMDLTMVAVTIANIILIIYETDEEAQCYPAFHDSVPQCPTNPENNTSVVIMNWVILIAYTVEALLRSFAERRAYLRSKVNLLDLFICVVDWTGRIIGSMMQLKWFRIFRVFRLCRAFRIVKAIPELNALAMGFNGSMRAIFFGSGLLLLLLVFCSILLVQFVHPVASRLEFQYCTRCSRGYASVMSSTLTLFQNIVAGDNWGMISVPTIEEKWYVGLLLPITMLLIGIGAMNLILAVIVDKAVEAREKNKDHLLSERVKESYRRRKEMLDIFHTMDSDESGTLDIHEISEAMRQNKSFRRLLRLADVRNEEILCILDILDADHGGDIGYKDFCDVLERFQAADTRKISVLTNMMVGDIRRQLKADRDFSLSTIRDLIMEIKKQLDTLVRARPQVYAHSGPGVNPREECGQDYSSFPSETQSKLQNVQDITILTYPSLFDERAPDVLQQLEAELAECERGSSRRQKFLLGGLDESFQDLESNLCASQQCLLKVAFASHLQRDHNVKHRPHSLHQAHSHSDDILRSGSSVSPKDPTTAPSFQASPTVTQTRKATALNGHDSEPPRPLQKCIYL